MSRLDSMLRRLTAQRDGLNWAAAAISEVSGDVLDLGLGNGRTYDHLRSTLPERRVWVIDRVLQCHPSCVPPEADFLQGEAEPMLARLAASDHRLALAHYDLGFGVKDQDVAEAAKLSPALAAVMAPGGLVISGQPLVGFTEIDGPAGIPEGRYMFYRAG
ncbi:class I SAM-dependent methyltransferase [Tritonibacter horizontis]|uniref:S-adenosyl-L-methionine methyltransferase n=1 Tax=Tritonibacter horizontis TaxID=1768241 RepID=A0A132C1I3_9RHOB|nr:class I SAM-dependent methyltransferase [Tritonibacter horizontis]KUP94451.1 S-adenosyl-L-methionine methyltransferase [Tritonibacter horizontis]